MVISLLRSLFTCWRAVFPLSQDTLGQRSQSENGGSIKAQLAQVCSVRRRCRSKVMGKLLEHSQQYLPAEFSRPSGSQSLLKLSYCQHVQEKLWKIWNDQECLWTQVHHCDNCSLFWISSRTVFVLIMVLNQPTDQLYRHKKKKQKHWRNVTAFIYLYLCILRTVCMYINHFLKWKVGFTRFSWVLISICSPT